MKHKPSTLEVIIFGIVSLVFVNSLYSLFMNNGPTTVERAPASLKSEAGPTVSTAGSGGGISGGVPSMVPYETRCQNDGEFLETAAAKVRITGALCGYDSKDSLIDSKVVSETTKYAATVFADVSTNKFSTDFIPLDLGKNKIILEFRYRNGKLNQVPISIQRK